MKKLSAYALTAMCAVLLFASCKKGDQGPAGPQGAPGAQGPQGTPGLNANVTQFVFSAHDFSAADGNFVTTTTADTASKSIWHAYLVYNNNSGGYTYAVPGAGFTGATTYRHYHTNGADPTHFIAKVSGGGEAYNAVKIVRVYTGDVRAGRVAEPNWNNYEEVRAFYNLPK